MSSTDGALIKPRIPRGQFRYVGIPSYLLNHVTPFAVSATQGGPHSVEELCSGSETAIAWTQPHQRKTACKYGKHHCVHMTGCAAVCREIHSGCTTGSLGRCKARGQ